MASLHIFSWRVWNSSKTFSCGGGFFSLLTAKNAFNHSKNFPPVWEFFFILTIGITEFMCLVMQFNLTHCLTQLLFGLSTQILSTYISNLDISENWQNCLYIHVCFVDCYTCRSFSNKQVKTFFLRDPLWIKFGCATWPLKEKRKEQDALRKKSHKKNKWKTVKASCMPGPYLL